MKKVLLFFGFVLFACFVIPVHGQQVQQSFEDNYFPPAGWKVVHIKGGFGWEASAQRPRTGLKSAYSAFEYQDPNAGYDGLGDSWLITPKIMQIQAGDQVTFYMAAQYNDNIPLPYYDSLKVYYSTTGNEPADFVNLLTAINLNGLGTAYQQVQLNLPPAAYGQNIYIGIRNFQNQGNGLFLDDFSAGTKLANDAASSTINLSNDKIFAVGETIEIVDTVFNNGTTAIPAGIPVKYRINGGTPITVNTSTGIAVGASTTVKFTGSNAFVPATAGIYKLEVYTDWPIDMNRSNDTLKYTMTVQAPIGIFPYFMDFNPPTDWTQTGSLPWEYIKTLQTDVLGYPVTNPAGFHDTAALAFTWSGDNKKMIMRTPIMNFSSTVKPMLNFYVAADYRNPNQFNDSLLIAVSTDGGVTFGQPLYLKANKTDPTLATVNIMPKVFFVPKSENDWRHEIVDLSGYAGNPNVVIAFIVHSHMGNNVWIDNVKILDQPVASYTAAKVTAPGVITGPYNTKVQFVTIASQDSIRMQARTAYPEHRREEGDRFEENTTATTNDGTIATPDFVTERYFTIAYSGNGTVRAQYNISIDASTIPGMPNLDKVYIMKRADETGRWVALSTTRSGNILTASGLNRFSDFAVGTAMSVIPVTVLTFSGKADGNQVELTWKTSQEANILSYDIQRWNGREWVWIGNVRSLKISMQNEYSFTDHAPIAGSNLYRLKINQEMGSIDYSSIAKVNFAYFANKVYQNVPNPLRDHTLIRYDLSKTSTVKVAVFDSKGQQISVLENALKPSGSHQVRWNAGNVPAGTYFYQVTIDGRVTSKMMIKVH